MRPIRLEIQGFTAFREKCEINFSHFDLFAITGQTGAGKTSLLDAMTYALYGKTSRLNKAGKDLISQGANSMSVLLHFRVGPKEYRVARIIKGASVTARLETFEGADWAPASGSIRDVDQQIERIIGLNFGGFTKTVILPQGKFDEFLRGEAEGRRKVLEELLDVKIYQRMMKAANEKAKDAGIRAEERTANIDASATQEALTDAKRRLAEHSEQESRVAAQRDRLVAALSVALTLREKRQTLAITKGALEDLGWKYEETTTAATKAREEADKESDLITDIVNQIEGTPYDGSEHLRLNGLLPQAERRHSLGEQLTAEKGKLETTAAEVADGARSVEAARLTAKAETERLGLADQQRKDAALRLQDLQGKHGSADAISLTIKDLESALKEAGAIPSLRLEVGKLEERAQTVAAENDAAGKSKIGAEHTLEEADKLYENLHARDRGAALRHELKPGEPCPVCEQVVLQLPPVPDSENLINAGRRVAEAKAAIKQWEGRLSALATEAQSIPGKIAVASEKANRLQQRLDEMVARVQVPVGHRAEEAMEGLRALVSEIKAAELGAQQATSKYETALQSEGKATTALKSAEHEKALLEAQVRTIGDRIEEITHELTALDGVLRGAPDLEQIKAQIKALDGARAKRAELEGLRTTRETALRSLQDSVLSLVQTLATLESQRSAAKISIHSIEKDVAKSGRQLKKTLGDTVLDDSSDEAAQVQRLEESSRKALESVQQEVAKCGFEIGDLEKRIDRNEKFAQEIAQLKAESALYRDLGTWLNAGNFQQYVLGSAFEILAKEGSKHLRQLSAGRYEFVFEDDEFMVSDHSNADETRSVKTLSGGESFLASLSLALALAESITQLNGEQGAVSLESLFLDEGFSTLDSETLTKVADAIELLQDGRRLIGIITHVQSLADQMPVQIQIEKTVSGSRIAHSRASLVTD